MKRSEILLTPEYWITQIQIMLYNCAEKFMSKTHKNRTQLAQYLGVSKGYVSQILNGDYDHRLSKFVELSLAFGYIPQISFVPVEQMITEDQCFFETITSSNSLSTTFTTCTNDTQEYQHFEKAA